VSIGEKENESPYRIQRSCWRRKKKRTIRGGEKKGGYHTKKSPFHRGWAKRDKADHLLVTEGETFRGDTLQKNAPNERRRIGLHDLRFHKTGPNPEREKALSIFANRDRAQRSSNLPEGKMTPGPRREIKKSASQEALVRGTQLGKPRRKLVICRET